MPHPISAWLALHTPQLNPLAVNAVVKKNDATHTVQSKAFFPLHLGLSPLGWGGYPSFSAHLSAELHLLKTRLLRVPLHLDNRKENRPSRRLATVSASHSPIFCFTLRHWCLESRNHVRRSLR